MPTFANILIATIVDMDDNRVIKSFGIKKGIELEKSASYESFKMSHLYDSYSMTHFWLVEFE